MRNGKSLHATGKSPFKVVNYTGCRRNVPQQRLCVASDLLPYFAVRNPIVTFINSIKPASADGGKKEPPAVVFLQQEVLLLLTRFIVISHPHKAAE